MTTPERERRRSSVFGRIMDTLKGSSGSGKPKEATEGEPQKQAEEPPPTYPLASQNASLGKPFEVKGKSAIITGAGSGINHRFAKLLLSKGCNVLIADLALRPEAQELIDEYSGKDESKPRCAFARTDVTVWADLSAMFKACYSEFGALDIVCPGAGVFEPPWSNFWVPPGSSESKDAPDSNHYRSLDINLIHPIRTTQLAIAEFLNPTQGEKVSIDNPKQIVLISSIAGQLFGLPTPLYVACKWGVSGFIRSMGGLEKKLGIKTTGVAPGVVKTPLFLETDKMALVSGEDQEWVTPEEVAEAMLECMQSPDIAGGTIVEVGMGVTRTVKPFNDPGPMGRPGNKATHPEVAINEVFERLAEDEWGKRGL